MEQECAPRRSAGPHTVIEKDENEGSGRRDAAAATTTTTARYEVKASRSRRTWSGRGQGRRERCAAGSCGGGDKDGGGSFDGRLTRVYFLLWCIVVVWEERRRAGSECWLWRPIQPLVTPSVGRPRRAGSGVPVAFKGVYGLGIGHMWGLNRPWATQQERGSRREDVQQEGKKETLGH